MRNGPPMNADERRYGSRLQSALIGVYRRLNHSVCFSDDVASQRDGAANLMKRKTRTKNAASGRAGSAESVELVVLALKQRSARAAFLAPR